MQERNSSKSNDLTSRRNFVKTAATAAAALPIAGSTISAVAAPGGFHHQVNDTLNIGLIGCGGRGTGAVMNAFNADDNIKITALADPFQDRIDQCKGFIKAGLAKDGRGDAYAVAEDHEFTGLDCSEKLIASDVDVVLLCSPPHFRPNQMELAVSNGKHIFCEKPIAVDPPGVRRVRAASEEAEQKGLSLVSGLCWRYSPKIRETVKRVKDGAIGEVRAMEANFMSNVLWHRGNNEKWSEMEYQCRNWLYFTWLSGDLIAEQHIHSLDKALWIMDNQPPVKCYGSGGRISRIDEEFGNVYDHFHCCFEWENGVKAHSNCRQYPKKLYTDTNDYIVGTKGTAQLIRGIIENKEGKWKYRPAGGGKGGGGERSMYDVEHDELFAAIRSGEPINNGGYMCDATLMAIMGRQAAYTGTQLKWDEFINSDLDLSPAAYEFGPGRVDPIARPGTAWPA